MFNFFRSIRLSVILLAVVILLIFLHYLSLLGPVENLFIRILMPIQRPFYSMGASINNFYFKITSNKNYQTESQRLNEEVKRLTIENAQLKSSLEEKISALNQKNYLASSSLEGISAKVIGKNPEPNLQAIILDKGSNDGVRENLPLITENGILVGKISKVRSNSSEAIMINDSRSRIAALIQNDSKTQGVVVGQHGLSLTMELIAKNEPVKEGDLVVTSGLEPTIPRGLVIGKINRIFSEANSSFQTAGIQPLVRVDSLIIVTILKSNYYD